MQDSVANTVLKVKERLIDHLCSGETETASHYFSKGMKRRIRRQKNCSLTQPEKHAPPSACLFNQSKGSFYLKTLLRSHQEPETNNQYILMNDAS